MLSERLKTIHKKEKKNNLIFCVCFHEDTIELQNIACAINIKFDVSYRSPKVLK